MSWSESFCLSGPSVWLSDVFSWRSGASWGSHAGFYIQISSLMECKWVFRAVSWLLLLCACTHLFFCYSSCALPHELSMKDYIKSPSLFQLQPTTPDLRKDTDWKPCSVPCRDNEIVLFNSAWSCSVQHWNSLSQIQQPLRTSLIYQSQSLQCALTVWLKNNTIINVR